MATASLTSRVTYEAAAEMLHISYRQLKRLIARGEIPVIQPPSGRQHGLIEVSALEDYLERQRAQARREATRRKKSTAATKS